ncbi:MAG: DUF3365 domain-containing protein [Xanthomonadales bacterium]|nr:DUF3365 domain-containing protein [Xanthomonadales bacterium]NIX12271.1 DUF3365 domain-containing protein [Xanthomonadales bacterium]
MDAVEAEVDEVASIVAAANISGEIARSRAAIQSFAAALQAEISKAMAAGGPDAAIRICNTEAVLVAAKASGEQGVNLGRVSLKNRSPLNYPNDWQAAVLLEFEERKAAGEDVGSLEWSELVEAGDRLEFRYMKAIPTQAFCLQCHGPDIAPEVQETLAMLYPEDLATGFEEGDIRGAFVARGVVGDENL